jgi:uncharacterized protein YecT (DUF1311 family)
MTTDGRRPKLTRLLIYGITIIILTLAGGGWLISIRGSGTQMRGGQVELPQPSQERQPESQPQSQAQPQPQVEVETEAEESEEDTAPDTSCKDPETDADWTACRLVLLRHIDGRLNKVYEQLVGGLDEKGEAALRAEQRDWLRERNIKCALDAAETSGSGGLEAIARDSEKTKCVLKITDARVSQLDELEANQAVALAETKAAKGGGKSILNVQIFKGSMNLSYPDFRERTPLTQLANQQIVAWVKKEYTAAVDTDLPEQSEVVKEEMGVSLSGWSYGGRHKVTYYHPDRLISVHFAMSVELGGAHPHPAYTVFNFGTINGQAKILTLAISSQRTTTMCPFF